MNYPALTSNLCTPRMMWYQTDVKVVIRILIQDVKDYFLRVQCDHLLFSTSKNGKDYYVCLYLFGTVVAEKTTHVNVEREIRINLIKAHKWAEWLRLHIEKDKNPMIVSDPDQLYQNDWSAAPLILHERESFAEYKRRNDITQIKPDVPSTDEEESDDDILDMLMY